MLKDSHKKLKELILYICRREEGDETFGALKLNKLLFFSDFLAFQRLGKPITGEEYFRLKDGPAPRQLVPARDALMAARRLTVQSVTYYTRVQQKPIALDDANLDVFTGAEIAIVEEVIRKLEGKNGTECSGLSHKFVGWIYAKNRETIPYEVALVSTKSDPTIDDIQSARELDVYAKQVMSA